MTHPTPSGRCSGDALTTKGGAMPSARATHERGQSALSPPTVGVAIARKEP
jgi:hypothetical protein